MNLEISYRSPFALEESDEEEDEEDFYYEDEEQDDYLASSSRRHSELDADDSRALIEDVGRNIANIERSMSNNGIRTGNRWANSKINKIQNIGYFLLKYKPYSTLRTRS